MKSCFIGIMSALMVFSFCQAHAQPAPTRIELAADTTIANQQIESNVLQSIKTLPSRTEQIEYLLKLAQSRAESEKANADKSSAIRLLGRLGDTNAIETLLQNLTFVDLKTKTCPAVYALGDMGDSAVEPIFKFIQNTDDRIAAVRGAEAIQRIKCKGADCSEYFKWLKPRLPALPKHLQEALGVVEH